MDSNTFYATSDANELIEIDTKTGDYTVHQSQISGGGTVIDGPAGVAYEVGHNGNISKINTDTGSVDWTREHTGLVNTGVDYSEETGTLYASLGDSTVYTIDQSNGDISESFDTATDQITGGEVVNALSASGGSLYVGSSSGNLYGYDNPGENAFAADLAAGDTQAVTMLDSGGGVVGATVGETLHVFDEDGGKITEKSPDSSVSSYVSVSGDGQQIYRSSGSGSEVAYDSTGSELWSGSAGHSFVASVDWYKSLDGPDGDVTGTVVNQDGAVVPGASVEVWSVNKTTFDSTDKYDERIQELRDMAENPLPDAWKNQGGTSFDVLQSYEGSSGVYPLVHHKTAWDRSTSTPLPVDGGGELSTPAVRVVPGEPYRVSMWDINKDDAGGWTFDDPYDQQLPGASASGEFRVERLSASGDVIESYTAETSPTHETKRAIGGTVKEHETASVAFKTGVYRITATDSGASYYVISGDPDTVASAFRTQLETEAGQLTDRAETLQQRIENSMFDREVVQADANGEFNVSVPPAHEVVRVQAYSATGDVVSDQQLINMTLDDLRSAYETADYNGSIYLPGGIVEANPPATGVTVPVQEVPNPATTLANLPDRLQDIRDFIDSEHFEDLESFFGDPTETVDDSELVERYNATVVRLIEGTALEEPFKKLAESQGVTGEISQDLSRAEMEQQIQIAQTVINQQTNGENNNDLIPNPFAGDGDGLSIEKGENGTVTVSLSGENLNNESVTFTVAQPDGSTDVVDPANITVDEGMLSDELQADIQLNESALASEIEMIRTTGDGDVIRETRVVRNPATDGTMPAIESINVDSLRPGVGSPVTASVTGGDGFQSLGNATVYTPSGAEQTLTVSDSGDVSFTPNTAGTYTLQLPLESTSGHTVTETVRFEVVSERTEMPPTVKVTSGPSGTYAIAADGVDSATISEDTGGSQTAVTARFDGGDVPSETLHVYTGAAEYSLQQYTVRVADASGSLVQEPVRVAIHALGMPDGAHVKANGAPVTFGAANGAGEVTREGAGTVIKTVTSDGSAQVNVNGDPGWLEQLWWGIQTNLPDIPNPFGFIQPVTGTLTVLAETPVTAFSADAGVTGVMGHA
ncbi:hypothetical protein C478_07267 [Natrinema thermotolerans DSM 11552]|nr:hypothetical protein C478_07267 [Natrinema thermotolerans DSM 11552]